MIEGSSYTPAAPIFAQNWTAGERFAPAAPPPPARGPNFTSKLASAKSSPIIPETAVRFILLLNRLGGGGNALLDPVGSVHPAADLRQAQCQFAAAFGRA